MGMYVIGSQFYIFLFWQTRDFLGCETTLQRNNQLTEAGEFSVGFACDSFVANIITDTKTHSAACRLQANCQATSGFFVQMERIRPQWECIFDSKQPFQCQWRVKEKKTTVPLSTCGHGPFGDKSTGSMSLKLSNREFLYQHPFVHRLVLLGDLNCFEQFWLAKIACRKKLSVLRKVDLGTCM